MPEVKRRQVERVDHEHPFADPEVGVYPEENERGCEEVVHDEVGADVRGDLDQLGVEGEETKQVAKLRQDEEEPRFCIN